MTNIEKLKISGGLKAVIGRLGGGEYGKRVDNVEEIEEEINEMSNHELVAKIAGWELGDETWWNNFKGIFDKLEELDKDSKR